MMQGHGTVNILFWDERFFLWLWVVRAVLAHTGLKKLCRYIASKSLDNCPANLVPVWGSFVAVDDEANLAQLRWSHHGLSASPTVMGRRLCNEHRLIQSSPIDKILTGLSVISLDHGFVDTEWFYRSNSIWLPSLSVRVYRLN